MKLDSDKKLEMVLIKIADDILISGTDEAIHSFIQSFGRCFKLQEVNHGPSRLRFFD